MARSAPWRRTCSDLVNWRQIEAQNATIYILREVGPTGFLLKEDGVSKPCKAFLGDPHSCTCAQFMKDRDLCKHICWLLLKKFRVPTTNQMSWQGGLVEREINEILRGLTQQQRKKVNTAVSRWRRPLSKDSNEREVLPQRDINADDVCPICQDELLEKRLPVTYCKYGCGNSIHIKCMKIWAEHQKSQGETLVKCPFCREDFGPFEMLKYENRNAEGGQPGGRMDRHIGIACQSCRTFPIEGKCYRCSSCTDYHLCQSCFNTPIHTQHPFQYRHKRNQRWRPAGRAYGAVLPQAVMDDLVNRDISDNDYDLLMQLESNTQNIGSDIPEEVIQSFPLEKVRENGPLLAPGIQCRVCLRGYSVGQMVRKLPRCKHKYHRDCIDNWLLHSKPTCPIDGHVVWDAITAQYEEEEGGAQTRARQQQRKPSQSDNGVQQVNNVNLEIPGVGLSLRVQAPPEPRTRVNQGRGHPPVRRGRDHEDREVARVLAGLQTTNFSLSGTAVTAAVNDYNNDPARVGLPGSRLLDRANVRHTVISNRLAHLQNGGYQPHGTGDTGALVTSQITEQENIDPLDQVVAANYNAEMDHAHGSQETSPRHGNHGNQRRQQQNRAPNHGSLFSQPVQQPDITENLLANMERLSPYQENPNIFANAVMAQAAQQMQLDSVRTNEVSASTEHLNRHSEGQNQGHSQIQGQGSLRRPSNEESHARTFSDVPQEQRLFANNGSAESLASQSGSQLMFNPHNPGGGNVPSNRGGKTKVTGTVKKGRQTTSVSSAPASLDGERGRRAERGGLQNQSTTRNRSGSRDRGRDHSRDRGLSGGHTIPKEGESLLQRLSVFSDLYLGNHPTTTPPTSGIYTTATGLPPRPQKRQLISNHAAARQRRFENDRRTNNFSLSGNAVTEDLTLRDLLG